MYCEWCEGTGDCPECHNKQPEKEDCELCAGTGFCADCDGTGEES